MKRHIHDFVRACVVCHRDKTETLQPAGLLQPLSIPEQIWSGATTHVMLTDKANQEESQNTLKDFSCLFYEPVGLYAKRDCDHKIILEQGTKPVVV
uniref:Integrase zinc-binding domain-containing protein n=1 Tax=Solanum lycopersicum TaxID=4081 RepID=A0A3Q7G3N6_SOLLC